MTPASVHVKEILIDNGVDWPIFIGTSPASPAENITIYDTGGAAGNPDYNHDDLTFMVRVKARSYESGYSIAYDIKRLLTKKRGWDTEGWHYTGFWLINDINRIGKDDDGLEIFTINFMSMREQVAVPPPPPVEYVPRLVPTATWPDQDADEFTIIIKIANSGSFPVWPILYLVDTNNKALGIAGSLNPVNNYLSFDGELLFTIDPRPEGGTEYLLSFSEKTTGVRTITLYVNGYLIGSDDISIANTFAEFAGIGSTIIEPYITTTNQATVTKVLKGIYTSFSAANAVTGEDLIFNGLDFEV